MQASLYRFKSRIVKNAHTAITAITQALQQTAVHNDALDFNENMFSCCEDNEVNSPGYIYYFSFRSLKVSLSRIAFALFFFVRMTNHS